MLDTATKRRIDSARDILVGKVPDPKSQVEQITIALIYKFMDDMDAESEELGGKRKFFEGDFARYGWAKLLRGGLGGHEMLGLYAEAITRMTENPAIPPLFRDIFKNAYLPYRDPETLRAFLRIIDEFTYDHSERLGDAFEYLLSVLGSQGDAGQFRTPRHIIDFMVAVLDPKKDETILDPACGTAGFLISSYKHIANANKDAAGHSSLTPDERGRMAKNLKGYDISPDMVRLSLVNLYLHGFTDPHIDEYDTLTSEEKWNEYADVILANPPFMSPKGGIKPHRRFSVQSKRSEVLFVDYMAEHLTPKGRAGIIVPEGIIFQSQGAYTELRKMLVENYLVAVVSLPAGVFNPYSGVKTSILILDKALAKGSGTVGFFKIEADGYGLGAQRRAVEQNDLPAVAAEIGEYLGRLRSGAGMDDFAPAHGLIVAKEKIGAGGDWNLSGERYREGAVRNNVFPLVRIGEVCSINPRKSLLGNLPPDTLVSFVPMTDLNEHNISFQPKETKPLSEVSASYTYFEDNDVLLAKVTPCFENGKVGIARRLKNGIGFGSSEFYVLRAGEEVLPEWLYFCTTHELFRNAAIEQMTGTGGLQRVPRGFVEAFQIPLPPLSIQQEIVAEIEGYQKVIDGARAVVAHYKPQIPVHPDWPMVELGKATNVISGYSFNSEDFSGTNPIKSIKIANVGVNEFLETVDANLPSSFLELYSDFVVNSGDLVIALTRSIISTGLKVAIVPLSYHSSLVNQRVASIKGRAGVSITRFVYYSLLANNVYNYISEKARSLMQPNLSVNDLKQLTIPLPPLPIQQSIVAEIEAEQALVAANRELITRFEAKIAAALARVWGGEAGAPAQPAGSAMQASGEREALNLRSGPLRVAAEGETAYSGRQ